jgi:transposase
MDSIPKAALRLLYNCTEEYVLVLWLDQEPHAEIKEENKADFSRSLAKWKKNILPTLERSEYKIYVRGKQKIIEADF